MIDTTDVTAFVCFNGDNGESFGGTQDNPIARGLLFPVEGISVVQLAIKSARELGANRAVIVGDKKNEWEYLSELQRLAHEETQIPLAFLGLDMQPKEAHQIQPVIDEAKAAIDSAIEIRGNKLLPIYQETFTILKGHRCIYTYGTNPILRWHDDKPMDLLAVSNTVLEGKAFDDNTIFTASKIEDFGKAELEGARAVAITSRIGADPHIGSKFFLSKAFTGSARDPDHLKAIKIHLEQALGLKGEKTTL